MAALHLKNGGAPLGLEVALQSPSLSWFFVDPCNYHSGDQSRGALVDCTENKAHKQRAKEVEPGQIYMLLLSY